MYSQNQMVDPFQAQEYRPMAQTDDTASAYGTLGGLVGGFLSDPKKAIGNAKKFLGIKKKEPAAAITQTTTAAKPPVKTQTVPDDSANRGGTEGRFTEETPDNVNNPYSFVMNNGVKRYPNNQGTA